MKAEFDERSHNRDERPFDRHGSACEGDEKNRVEGDEESQKTHPRNETVGLEMIENGGSKGSEDDGTVLSLLANGSGAA